LYKIDKNTWDDMRSTKNKVLTEDFSRVIDHDSAVYSDEPKIAEQISVKPKHAPKVTTGKEVTADKKIQINSEHEAEAEKKIREMQERQTAKEIEKAAYEKGYNDCAEKMKETVSVKLSELINKQNETNANLEKELTAYKEKLDSEILDNILGLSLEIAEKIVNSKLQKHDDLFVKIVKNAIAHMDSDEDINVMLSHNDYYKHFASEVESIREELGIQSLNFSPNANLDDGGCILETDKTFIDAGIQTQLKVIADSITKETDKYDEAL